MKKILCLASTLLLISCGGEKNNGADSTAGSQTKEPPLPVRDSVRIDEAQSSMTWKRDRKVKDVVQKIKFGKATIDMKLDEASFTLNGEIPVHGGVWYTSDGIFDGGVCRFDMTKIQGLQVGNDQHLEFTSPDYLDVEHYPTAKIRFIKINRKAATQGGQDSAGNSKKNISPDCEVEAELTIKDTTAKITFPAECNCNEKGIPASLSATFGIDGIAWGLNRKNKKQKVLKDQLEFTVALKTKQ